MFRRTLAFLKEVEPVFQIAYVVVSGLVLFGVFAAVKTAIAKSTFPWTGILVAVVAACGGAGLTYYLLKRSPSHKYRILKKELVYVYTDETHMCCSRIFDIQPRISSLAKFTDRYRWSGHGSVELRLVSDGGQAIDREYEREFWQFYDVTFTPPIKKDKPVRVHTEVDCEDTSGTSKPFLSTTIEQPTDSLTLRVILPLQLRPKSAIAQVYQHYTADEPLDFEELPVDPLTGEIKWVVPPHKLKMWQKYVIYFQQ